MSQAVLTRSTTPVIVTPTPTTGPVPLVVAPGVGEVLDFTPTERFTWKATGDTTNGAVDTFEATLQPGYPGAPEHIHDANDEIFYVLEGAFRFKVGDDLIEAPAGTFAFVPRGTAHTWVNTYDGASKLLTQFLPGGMRGMFEATSELIQASHRTWRHSRPPRGASTPVSLGRPSSPRRNRLTLPCLDDPDDFTERRCPRYVGLIVSQERDTPDVPPLSARSSSLADAILESCSRHPASPRSPKTMERHTECFQPGCGTRRSNRH